MGESHADVSKQVKMYVAVFLALAVFTVLTVGASRMEFSKPMHVAVALVIATIKASLVAAVFMHLKWERAKVLWGVLALCALFFVVLVLLPVLTMSDVPPAVHVGTWG